MLNIPILKFEKSCNYLKSQLEIQSNNKQLILDIITNIGLIISSSSAENRTNYTEILSSANKFLHNISSNITAIEQLNLEISNITKELSDLLEEQNKTTKTKEFYIAAFSNVKRNIILYSKKFQNIEEKLDIDNKNFNEFINLHSFKYNFNSTDTDNSTNYEFTGFSINETQEDISDVVEEPNIENVLINNVSDSISEDVSDVDDISLDIEDLQDELSIDDISLDTEDLQDELSIDDIEISENENNNNKENSTSEIEEDIDTPAESENNFTNIKSENTNQKIINNLNEKFGKLTSEFKNFIGNFSTASKETVEEEIKEEISLDDELLDSLTDDELLDSIDNNIDVDTDIDDSSNTTVDVVPENTDKPILSRKQELANNKLELDTNINFNINSYMLGMKTYDSLSFPTFFKPTEKPVEDYEIRDIFQNSVKNIKDETVKQEAIEQEFVEEETVKQESIEQESVKEEIVEQETVEEETVEQQSIEQETVEEKVIEENNSIKNEGFSTGIFDESLNLINEITSKIDFFNIDISNNIEENSIYEYVNEDTINTSSDEEYININIEPETNNDIIDNTNEEEINIIDNDEIEEDDLFDIIETDEETVDIITTFDDDTDLKIKHILEAEADNENLIISERMQKIYLPYKVSELITYIESYPNVYESLQDVVKKEFILPFNYFMKHPYKSRFSETYNIVKNREGKNSIKAFCYSLKVSKRNNLNPAIIASCKSLNELETYLYYLDSNNTKKFKFFNIIYEVNLSKN